MSTTSITLSRQISTFSEERPLISVKQEEPLIDSNECQFFKSSSVILQKAPQLFFNSTPLDPKSYGLDVTVSNACSIANHLYSLNKYITVHSQSSEDYCDIKVVLSDELCRILSSTPRKILLIDCQHPLQYEQAHVRYAINLFSPSNVIEYLFGSMSQLIKLLSESVTIILYCKNGKRSSPFMMRLIRKIDRQIHQGKHPLIAFKSIYLLQGGIKAFKLKHSVYQ